jgi:hypothetical protein
MPPLELRLGNQVPGGLRVQEGHALRQVPRVDGAQVPPHQFQET